MTAVKDDPLFDESIVYNGVQFGGSDAAFDSIPASKYDINAVAVYDEAGRSVTHLRYTLEVRCTFFAASEAALAANLLEVRRRLLQPGRQLKMIGSALGFQDLEPDMIFGPKPISFSAPMTHGLRSSDTVWICEFNGPPCRLQKSKSPKLAFSAFNYGTTWVNDFEGKTTRTISGYFTIPEVRSEGTFGANEGLNRASIPQLQNVADELRKNVNIALPDGFKRVTNTWTQNKAKNRMDFSIIDISVPGRSYPPGVSAITNDVIQMATDPLTFAQADIALSATITVAPNRPPALAGAYFLQMALARQASMQRTTGKNAGVIPTRLVTSAGLFDNARTTSFLMQWRTTGCLQDLFFSGPWDAIPNSNYTLWRTSMAPMWNNHGVQLTKADPTEDAVISICDELNSFTIGKTPAKDPTKNAPAKFVFGCPEITKQNSWVDYDVQVSVFRVEHTSVLRRMVNAFASAASAAVDGSDSGSAAALIGMGASSVFSKKMMIGPKFESTAETEHIISQNGIPEQYVLLQAKGRRAKFDPVFPLLKTIGKGKARVIPADPAILGGVASRIERKIIAKFAGCEIRQMRGFQWYRVLDHVSDYGTKFNPVVCATTRGNEDKPAV